MKNIVRFIIITMVAVAPLYGQRIFFEPTIGRYAPDQYANKMSFGANIGINLPAGIQLYGGYAVWNSTKITVLDDTTSAFNRMDSNTRISTALVGLRENINLGDSKYHIRFGVSYSSQTTIKTIESLRLTNFTYETLALGGIIQIETGLTMESPNGGQLFLGFEYKIGEVPYLQFAVEGFGSTLEELNASREDIGLGPLPDKFNVAGLGIKVSYSIKLGI